MELGRVVFKSRAGRRPLQRSVRRARREMRTRQAVFAARILSLAASSDAATLEPVTGLCDAAANYPPSAAPSHVVTTRRGGRVARAAYVRPRARTGENTRPRFRPRGARAHQGLRAAKTRNRLEKSAAVTARMRLAHPPVQEGRPPGTSLFDPERGAVACYPACATDPNATFPNAASAGAYNKSYEIVGNALLLADGIWRLGGWAFGRAALRGTGTVWDFIKATQPVWEGTVVPRSFELATESGSVWVHGNATEHLAEYAASMLRRGVSPGLVNIGTQAQLTSLRAAVGAAIEGGVPYNQLINVGGWELRFAAPRAAGQLPALIHAMPF